MLQENSKGSDSGTGRAGKAKRALRAARKTRRGGRAAPKRSLYDEVTAQIIAQLEEGIFPWVKPWDSGNAVTGLPRNAISGRHYSGINILILWGAVIDGGYPSQDWLTFRQALAAGGCVRKGEKGRTIFYADRFTPDDEQHEQGEGDPRAAIPPCGPPAPLPPPPPYATGAGPIINVTLKEKDNATRKYRPRQTVGITRQYGTNPVSF